MNEEEEGLLFDFLCILFFFLSLIIFGSFAKSIESDTQSKACNDIRIIKKEDLIFDNYYLICSNGYQGEIDFNTYSRIISGEDYTLTLDKTNYIRKIKRSDK